MSSAPLSKKSVPSYIYRAATLSDTCDNIYMGKPEVLEKHKNKIVSMRPTEDDNTHRITVICDGGGYIPSFGVDVNKTYGATYLTFPVTDKKEQEGLKALDARIMGLASGDEWWPERPTKNGSKAPVMAVLEESYNPVLKPAKEKKSGDGFYPPKVKCGVPLVQATGEVAKGVKIVDYEGNPVSLHSLPGRKYDRIVFEIHYTYFKPPSEFGCVKRLKYVKLANDGGGGDPDLFDELNYLDDDCDQTELAKFTPMVSVTPVMVTPEDLGESSPFPLVGEKRPTASSEEETLLGLLEEDDAPRKKRSRKHN
jgi:hypothetical protein